MVDPIVASLNDENLFPTNAASVELLVMISKMLYKIKLHKTYVAKIVVRYGIEKCINKTNKNEQHTDAKW